MIATSEQESRNEKELSKCWYKNSYLFRRKRICCCWFYRRFNTDQNWRRELPFKRSRGYTGEGERKRERCAHIRRTR